MESLKLSREEREELKMKKTQEVRNRFLNNFNFFNLCLDCEWYGQVYCSGDVIQDLFAWWFKMRCSSGKMRVEGTQWRDVVTDPRFEVIHEQVAWSMGFYMLFFQERVRV
jgi:hypothetical protein